MAAASSPVRCKMEYHEAGFAADQRCFKCEKGDDLIKSKLLGRVQVVVSGSSSTHPLLSDDPVHLNCHHDLPFHYSCLQDFCQRPFSDSLRVFCPFDGQEVITISSRTDQAPAVDNSSTFVKQVSKVALTNIILHSPIYKKDDVHKW